MIKRLAAAILVMIISIIPAGGSYVFAEDAVQTTLQAAVEPTAQKTVLPAKPISVKYSRSGGYEVVRIKAEGYADYNAFELKSPFRIVIDLKNTKAPANQVRVKAGGTLVKQVRYARYSVDTSRVVLDVNEGFEYSVELEDGGVTVYVSKKQSQAALDKGKRISLGSNFGISVGNADSGSAGSGNTNPGSAGSGSSGSDSTNSGSSGSGDAVSISLKNTAGYRISRSTGPDRLVLTIPDAGVFGSSKLINVNSRQIGSISYKRNGKAGAVITINLNGQLQYETDESEGKLTLTFHWPYYTNIYYNNSYDRVYLTLSGTKLTEGAKYLKQLYTDEYDESENRYVITFPTGQSVIKDGILDINDAYLKSFEVRLDPGNGTTSIIFNGVGKNAYQVFTRESGLTAITIMKPVTDGQKLVVIDAGHGGDASGTTYGSTEEKNLNLDMAKRLDALLSSKGIRTYMLRDVDCNVDNYERVYIANKLNASLYLSIHVNAMDSKSYNGTMTLYCPSEGGGFTGLSFANIIQKNLLKALKTKDRGVISRPDLIVLRETEMPAALAEIAFLSNKTDRANLLKPTFRQKAAQALYDSVVQALPRLD